MEAEKVAPNSPLRRAPQIAEIPAEKLRTAELIGTPEVKTLLGYTRKVLHLHDGHTLAAFSFSGAAQANWMFLIDSRDLSAKRLLIPNNDIASHGAALGKDGNVYIMPYGNGRIHSYDAQAGHFETVTTELPEKEYTWEAFGASNGRIYFGTYPSPYLGEYDPATKKCALWKQVAPNTKYATEFSEDDAGRIRFKAWGPDEVWLSFDPQTRKLEPSSAPEPVAAPQVTLPKPPEGDTGFSRTVIVDGRAFALSAPTSRLWEIVPDKPPILRGDPQNPADYWYLEAVPGAVTGISFLGKVFRFDLKTGDFQSRQLGNRAPAGNPIMFLETISPRCVVGANYSQQNLFQIDPETGKIEASETMIARVSGEPMCAVGFAGKAYVGIYVQSVLSVYDPQRPFTFGTNPRELTALGPKYAQTRPRAAVTDGKLVYISSDSAYNYLGGALAVIDPQTEKVDVYHHLIRDQNLPTLAYDPTTKRLWGGTDRWGQMRSHPPTQESSLVYAFDPTTRKVVATLTPWPGSDVTNVLGVSANGILIAASGQEIALIDTRTREILYKGALSLGVPSRTRRGSDGFNYCLANGTLYRWDLTRNILTPVAASPGCFFLTEAAPGTWTLATAASIYRVRL